MSMLDDDTLVSRPAHSDEGAVEFELDAETLHKMKQREQQILQETQQHQQMQQPMDTASPSSVPVDLSDPGWVPVVDVVIKPSPLYGVDADPDVDPLQIELRVFSRFVPHLSSTVSSPPVPECQHANRPPMEESDGYSSDSEEEDDDDDAQVTTGADLHLTGNRQLDAQTLRRLIGMAEDDDNDDDDDDSSTDEEKEEKQKKRLSDKDTAAANAMQLDEYAEDDEEGGMSVSAATPLRTQNEVPISALPPVTPFTVSASDTLVSCGTFLSVVDGVMVVSSLPGVRALDVGSAICLQDRTPVGRVEEVFGPVHEAFYAIRPLPSFDLSVSTPVEGTQLFNVPALSSFVLPDTTPGSDASNLHDEEVEAEHQDFSDDEKEQQAKADRKKRKNNNKNDQTKTNDHNSNNQPKQPPHPQQGPRAAMHNNSRTEQKQSQKSVAEQQYNPAQRNQQPSTAAQTQGPQSSHPPYHYQAQHYYPVPYPPPHPVYAQQYGPQPPVYYAAPPAHYQAYPPYQWSPYQQQPVQQPTFAPPPNNTPAGATQQNPA